jgi:hypothetical protein
MRGGARGRSIDGVTHLLLTFLAYDLAIAVVLAAALGALVVVQGTFRVAVSGLRRVHVLGQAHAASVVTAVREPVLSAR